ncbi:uncharacterized protein LOC111069625 [Drosophila obscura]|uniref:uncharacterized protein LOC111069625 n=1 Tax=Drosophila obscura TaxID=7282 RepID=UPI001BB1A79F|nr:uncharacterized protein LOC111069625 [Drosophila obscura]
MVSIPKWCRRTLRLIRQNHESLAKYTIIWLLLVGIMHYSYVRNNCDLLWWKHQLTDHMVGPMVVMLYIIIFKVSLILSMTLWNYMKKQDKEQENAHEMPIAEVKRRYRRFIMMRLLRAVEKFVHRPLCDVLRHDRVRRRFLRRHEKFVKEVALFLWNARKLYERTHDQLYLPLHQVLLVDDRREEQLLQLGYGERLTSLKDLDIHKMVYG